MRETNTNTETLKQDPTERPWSDDHAVSANSEKSSLINKTSEKIRNASERVSEATSDITEKAKEQIRTTSDNAKERYSEIRDQVANTGVEAKKSIQSSFERHPLAYLTGTLAAGVIIGLSLPRSRQEREALSEQGKKIKATGEKVKSEALNAAKAATTAAATTFEEEISESESSD